MLAANQAYLISIGVPQEKQQKCLDAMDKYGDDQWWLSDDPKARAYRQMKAPFLLMPFSQFHEDMEILLNRPVWTHEFVSPKFKQEVERSWTYGVGVTSDKERQERFEESMQDLKNMGKEVIIVELEGE